ncbi:TetR/AcrR family transcriptional regulator [Nicoliella spurrieriana]|uniref:TetR/AcrR family transcriptional regulator n=1 Tax=Nicoliella spurrieriana TaxID=2925830 RepID=A0A976X5T3_9LACO|nr:TetR/AcrR family transcriptional regulator [Nicoliella spurrieriana]UQS87283.1 TetR/AcrR family transcriptional regulator [Nicoliella spurrieriana]
MAKYIKKNAKTDDLIISTTIKLAKEHGLFHVTISNIINEANINRSTFYRHFLDKYDLINEMENRVLKRIQLNQRMLYQTKIHEIKNFEISRVFFFTLLTIIDENHEILAFLFSRNGDPAFSQRLVGLFLEMSYESWNYIIKSDDSKGMKLFANYSVGAILASIKLWIDNYDQYTKQEVFDFLIKVRKSEISALDLDEKTTGN